MRIILALAAFAILLGGNLALFGISARQLVDAQTERAAAREQRVAADVQRRAIDAQRHAVEVQHAAVMLIGQHMREMLEAAREKR
jgi:hypothetical protein